MTQLTLLSGVPDDEGSPFDRIRRTRPDGAEYWSARELMALMSYAAWQNFQPIITKAWEGAKHVGLGGVEHFMDAHKVTASGPPARDVHLSRLACYLVTLAADESKPRVAEAKLYFAVKTREAEARREMTDRELAMMLARQLIAEGDRADREHAAVVSLERRREVDAPKVEAFDEYLDESGRYGLDEVGKMRGMPGPKLIYGWLQLHGFLRADGLPYQRWIGQQLFVVNAHGRVEVTHKGLTKLHAVRMDEQRAGQERL